MIDDLGHSSSEAGKGGEIAATAMEISEAGSRVAPELTELVELARNGCTASFNEISLRYRPRLIRFLESRFPSRRSDAEDVVQETLAKAWHHLNRYDAAAPFAVWLYTIANRTAIDALRSSRRKPKTGSLSGSELRPASDIADPTADQPRDALEMAEAAQNIWATAKELLNDTQFSMLWLRYGEDLAITDVAKILGKTNVSVRVSLHRAKAKIRTRMEADTRSPTTAANRSSRFSARQRET